MFAVPGWSVSADKLKSEVAGAPTNTAEPKKSNKRKRQPENVTSSNVADLWERVIEQKESPSRNGKSQSRSQPKEKQGKKDKKRQKVDNVSSGKEAQASHHVVEETPEEAVTRSETQEKPTKKEKKGKKDRQKSKETKNESLEAADIIPSQKSSGKAAASAVVPATSKLTPLQAAMREKLISARFRHLNETLYTRPSAEAFSLFEESPDMFTEYHEGFRRQVEVWPENPVEGYLADIRQRGRARFPSKDNHRHKKSQQQEEQQEAKGDIHPLPRNRATGTCVIADLGCGDARLASELQRDKKKLRLDILSFDLHSPHPLVTKADIANLPVANGTVDIVIFCLALMGTNWVDFIEEAYRILRWKGELWVAEIKSRFGHVGGGKKHVVVEHSVGHRRKPGATGAKKAAGNNKAGGNAAGDETTLLVEVDGVDDTRQQTDVSAFIKVLNQRGFVLVGQDQGPAAQAIDLSNKMFVKMRFLKAAPALKGKCVRQDGEEGGKSRLGGRLPSMAKKPRFLDADDEAEGDEAAVLKPCMYKIR